ncbi:MAG: hypothetical protein JRJ09_10060 [Deltaproteobacteria bacterium]|nr:hypothetical protein [Deltaproteobacteria bacterium]MBW2048852.1 hypothetical protein [Deltaproteobacteria bacterium]MBW2110121.1 hypothetical protein [Deltaproteobacteria bacterium]MBW2352595.1 hypothetical protein [Deltaproteobacteria bacterium]
MKLPLPEKALHLESLKKGGFNVPDFIYVPAEDFRYENFQELERFLSSHPEGFKVIARSAHPDEEAYKPGTFDSLETYADVAGIKYARNRIIKLAETAHRLSILRQQKFNNAPALDIGKMGVIVMPFIDGMGVMAKMLGNTWEFGYCRPRARQPDIEPFLTTTPHDPELLHISEAIQDFLGHRCEIEYIVSEDGDIHVVQAKDISQFETLDEKESERSIKLDGVRRIRERRSYRERPIFVLDSKTFYMRIIDKCEEMVLGSEGPRPDIEEILAMITSREVEFEDFALRHERFAILCLSEAVPEDLYQIAKHYLDDMPDLKQQLSHALYENLYKRDEFVSEADTLICKDKMAINLESHDAYGIATVRNPVWAVYWSRDRDQEVVREFKRLGFKTRESIGIEIDAQKRPIVYRL